MNELRHYERTDLGDGGYMETTAEGHDGKFNLLCKAAGPAFTALVAEMCQFFADQGGINHVVFDVKRAGDADVYLSVTMQRPNGVTPAERLKEMEERNAKLARALRMWKEYSSDRPDYDYTVTHARAECSCDECAFIRMFELTEELTSGEMKS